jgi:hypothetical protein
MCDDDARARLKRRPNLRVHGVRNLALEISVSLPHYLEHDQWGV